MDRQFVKNEKGLGPQGRIAVVRFDSGDNVNALSHQAMRELRDVPREFEDDLETSVVILTGSAKAFPPASTSRIPTAAPAMACRSASAFIVSGWDRRCARPGRTWSR